ncbi:hypothetical protein LXL04_006512 [Taraxacum kok-saghyz]
MNFSLRNGGLFREYLFFWPIWWKLITLLAYFNLEANSFVTFESPFDNVFASEVGGVHEPISLSETFACDSPFDNVFASEVGGVLEPISPLETFACDSLSDNVFASEVEVSPEIIDLMIVHASDQQLQLDYSDGVAV